MQRIILVKNSGMNKKLQNLGQKKKLTCSQIPSHSPHSSAISLAGTYFLESYTHDTESDMSINLDLWGCRNAADATRSRRGPTCRSRREEVVASPTTRNRSDVDRSTAMHNRLTRDVFAEMLMGKN